MPEHTFTATRHVEATRHPRPGNYGNPRWWVEFVDEHGCSGRLATAPNASVGYAVNNGGITPNHRNNYAPVPVLITVDGRGNIVNIQPVEEDR